MISACKPMLALMFGAAALALAVVADPAPRAAFAATSQVSITVNKAVITNGDIARRVAFLRLQRQKGDLNKLAKEQLVEESLKRQEIARAGMSVSTQDVDAAFARFAASNKLSVPQMTQIIEKAGVGVDHFKAYIAVSMSWPRVLNSRSSGGMSNQEAVTRMLQSKEKPVTTEYVLQQVIFVVPASKKGITGKRKAEAEASRAKFPGCEQAKVFAATMKDVSIRSLGRVLEPELPADWKPLIEKANGVTTGTRVTERGVEYLAICNKRQVNDDYAAEVVFRAEDLGKEKNGKNPREEKYLDDLRKKARIVYY
ncbi:MAG: molecular chaperone SurA [Rhizobium sp. 63-7]|nr:MAG: molecular chaperone SurA [Rhizobium sp. 63-7]